MIEKELKILDIHPDTIVSRLLYRGAVCVADDHIVDRIMTPHPDFPTSDRVRLRHYTNRDVYQITFKDKFSHPRVKLRHEYEFDLTDRDDVVHYFDGRSPDILYTKSKQRMSYIIDDVQFDIDIYPDIPPLLEIESLRTKSIYQWIERLHLTHHTIKPRGYRRMMKRYGHLVAR